MSLLGFVSPNTLVYIQTIKSKLLFDIKKRYFLNEPQMIGVSPKINPAAGLSNFEGKC
jgi:hypothetical protein